MSFLRIPQFPACMMPYINSQFMPRKVTDRPRAVPEGCTIFGFIGQYVEVKDDAVFTVVDLQ